MRKWLFVGAATIGFAGTAASQDGGNPYEPCSRIAEDAARLQCFDATYAREAALRETREQAALARAEEERQRERENFGLTGAQIAQRDRDELQEAEASGEIAPEEAARIAEQRERAKQQEKEEQAIRATIAEVFTDRQRNTVILLDNGQIWRTTSNRSYRGSVRDGWTVTIRKGAIGGYRLTFEDRNGYIGVQRIR